MKATAAVLCSLWAFAAALPAAEAADYYASPSGGGTCAQGSPCSLSVAVGKPGPGDSVYLATGTYSNLHPNRSGTASAWITFAADAGAVPVIEGGNVGSGSVEYVRYVGIVAKDGSSGGFGNGWTDSSCSTMSNGNVEYIDCIADGNGINGIAHYCAGGLHIKQSIVAHNGDQQPSWSSGVNLFGVQGGASSNVVEQTISFENIDISSNHTDGSGFIADQNSTGATFVNDIGFRNGGSCIRITNSTNTQIINATCVEDGQDPTAKYHDEIFFSDSTTTHQGALLRNNLAIPTTGQSGLTLGNGVTAENNLFNGAPSSVVSAAGQLDFHLAPGSPAIDAGASGSPTPADDIGFDWGCIKQQSGQAVAWWSYAVDYDYIAKIGGVAACFQSGARSGTPDVGAYEYGATPGTGTGGNPSAGGASSGGAPDAGNTAGGGSGAVTSTGGSTTGVTGTAGASGSTSGQPMGGSPAAGGVPSTGGFTSGVTGGTTGVTSVGGTGGTGGSASGADSSGSAGCGCRTAPSQNGNGERLGWIGLCLVALRRRRARQNGSSIVRAPFRSLH